MWGWLQFWEGGGGVPRKRPGGYKRWPQPDARPHPPASTTAALCRFSTPTTTAIHFKISKQQFQTTHFKPPFSKFKIQNSDSIDAVYKALTRSRAHPLGGTAYLAVDNEEEPYLVRRP